jgi:hypothetical protein
MNSGYISETESKHMVNILLQALIYLLDFYYIVDSLNQGIVILSFTVARIKKFIENFSPLFASNIITQTALTFIPSLFCFWNEMPNPCNIIHLLDQQ